MAHDILSNHFVANKGIWTVPQNLSTASGRAILYYGQKAKPPSLLASPSSSVFYHHHKLPVKPSENNYTGTWR